MKSIDIWPLTMEKGDRDVAHAVGEKVALERSKGIDRKMARWFGGGGRS